MNNNPLVCFFDSGIGGLCLLYQCVRKLPHVDFIYFADNFKVPYGALSHDELIKIADEKFSEMCGHNPAAAVVACNTLTAQCIEFLRSKYPFEIIGIQPAIKPAAAVGGKCLVLATQSTAKSDALKHLVEKFGCNRTEVAVCPDLAYYIEQNAPELTFNGVTKLLPAVKADTVVLGCTHYVFVKKIIENYYNCPVFDGIEGTAARLCQKLGIDDHLTGRSQKITFSEGDTAKNRRIFNNIIIQSGGLSQKE